jgi:tetratricopeptide (TPR) repeat protein
LLAQVYVQTGNLPHYRLITTAVKPLDPPDIHHLNAALGWLELGNHLEANAELENIAPAFRSHPAVLELRWQIFAKVGNWIACLDLATAMVAIAPEFATGWIYRASSLRRAPGGGLAPAQAVLLQAWQKVPREPIIAYNLACYVCQLGKLKDAWDWLEKAFDIGDQKTLKLMALEDPDLEKLWMEIGEI